MEQLQCQRCGGTGGEMHAGDGLTLCLDCSASLPPSECWDCGGRMDDYFPVTSHMECTGDSIPLCYTCLREYDDAEEHLPKDVAQTDQMEVEEALETLKEALN